MGNYFVYKVTHREFDEPWYIGISKNPYQRLQQHLTLTTSKINKMIEFVRCTFPSYTSLEVELEIVDEASTLKEARKLEREWIIQEVPMLNIQHNSRYKTKVHQINLCGDLFDLLEPYIKDYAQRKEATWKVIDFIEAEKD